MDLTRLVLAALVLALVAKVVTPACKLRLEIDPQASQFQFSGVNQLIPAAGGSGISAPIQQTPGTTKGFVGAIYMEHATLPACPTQAADWLAALPGFNMSSSGSSTFYSPVVLYPAILPGTTQSFPYSPQTLSVSMTATITAVDAGAGSFQSAVSSVIDQGWLYSSTPLTGARYDNLANLTSTATAAGTLKVVNSSVLVVDLPQLVFNFSTSAAISFQAGGPTFTSLSTMTITGSMLLQAQLSCTQYCGDHGRCAIVNGAPSCECECGWTQAPGDGSCSVPSGYCDKFGAGVVYVSAPGTAPGPPAGPAPAPPPTANDSRPVDAPFVAPGVCPSGYDVNPQGTACSRCSLGFTGGGCALCQNDTACQVAGGSPYLQCIRNATYLPRTQSKNYTCAIGDPAVQGLLGRVVQFICSTQAPSDARRQFTGPGYTVGTGVVTPTSSPVGISPFCSMTFRMPTFDQGQYARCTGWACKFGRNSSHVECGVVECSCPQGCRTTDGTDMEPTFKGIAGTISLDCDTAVSPDGSQVCSVALTGLPIAKITSTCNTSECYDPTANIQINYAADAMDIKGPLVSDPIVAAIPSMVLVALSAISLATLLAARQYVTGVPKGVSHAGTWAKQGDKPSSSQEAGPIAEGVRGVEAERGAIQQDSYSDDARPLVSHGYGTQGVPHVGAAAAKEGAVLMHMRQDADRVPGHGLHRDQQQPQVHEYKLEVQPLKVMPPAAAHENRMQFSFVDVSVVTTHVGGGMMCWPRPSEAEGPTSLYDRHAGVVPQQQRRSVALLQGVSGAVHAGEVLGVLGPSGSGKSTLLNTISGQIASGGAWHVSGTISMCGRPLTPRQLCRLTAFVAQHNDNMLRHLTVEEVLRCSASVRMGASATPHAVYQRVDEVLRELHIDHLRHSRSHRGNVLALSGGERQRVSIGTELVTAGPLLMLDEPVSGLDSYNALQVLTTLQAVASKGRVVITSLHQPSPLLFSMLDRALLIAQGHVVFIGPPTGAAAAFEAMGLKCPPDHFVAEYMLEVVGNPATLHSLLAHVTQPGYKAALHEAAADTPSSAGGSTADGVARIISQDSLYQQQLLDSYTAPVSPPLGRQAGVLAYRLLLEVTRNPVLILVHWLFAVVMGLIVGFVYFKVTNDTAGAQNRVGSIFFTLNLFGCIAVTAVDLMQLQRQVFEREMLRRFYLPWLYMGLKLLLDGLLLRLVPACIFSTAFYWLTSLRAEGQAFAVFLFVFCTYHCMMGALALLCACATGTPGRAVLSLLSVLVLSILFSGFLVNKHSITWVLRWLIYLSPIRYAWEALVVNELQPMILTLDAPGLPPVPPVQGRLFLGLLGVNPDTLTTNIIVLDCLYAAVVVGGFGALWLRLYLLRTGRA